MQREDREGSVSWGSCFYITPTMPFASLNVAPYSELIFRSWETTLWVKKGPGKAERNLWNAQSCEMK